MPVTMGLLEEGTPESAMAGRANYYPPQTADRWSLFPII